MQIREGGLDEPQVVALLRLHAEEMLANSPPGMCHFLDLSGLKTPDVTFWSLWEGEALAAIGALKQLDSRHGEIKSMRATPEWRGRGAGKAMLEHILSVAAERGYARLSLETGSTEAFAPALGLYARYGFEDCGPFGDYTATAFNRFMTLSPLP